MVSLVAATEGDSESQAMPIENGKISRAMDFLVASPAAAVRAAVGGGVSAVAILAAICLLVPCLAIAEVAIQADVSQQVVTLGANLRYSITITSNDERINMREFELRTGPSFDGFDVMSGSPSRSSQQHFMNDQMTEKHELTWRLIAAREDVARVGPVEAVYRGKSYVLPAQEVKVVREEAQQSNASSEPDLAGILGPQSDYADLNEGLKGRLFARLVVSNPGPYLQETVMVSCKVYLDPQLSGQIGNVGWTPPAWADFVAQNVKLDDLLLKPETFGGRQYQSVVISRFLLVPTRSGKVEIPLTRAECSVRVRTRPTFEDNFFGDSFFGSSLFDRSVDVRLPIAPVTLDVRPLPTEDRPVSFQNAVGNLALAASVDRREMTQDDLLTLRLEIGGEGYLGSIAQPKLPDMQGWTQAGSQVKIEGSDELKSFRGKKVFEILLRPEKTGQLGIPAIPYAVFNPSEKRYVEQNTEPFTILVRKGSAQQLIVSGSGVTSGTQPPPQFLGEQLAYIHTAYPGDTVFVPTYRRRLFPVLQVIPLVLVGLALGVRLRKQYLERHLDRLQYRAAGSRARRELRGAQAALRAGDSGAFYRKLGEALRGYLATKLRRSAAGLTLEEIERACLERGLADEYTRAIGEILEQCENARYLVNPGDAREMNATLDKSAEILKLLDKHLR